MRPTPLFHLLLSSHRPDLVLDLLAVPFETGTKTLMYAPDDAHSLYPAPVSSFTQRSQGLSHRYFDFRFLGEPKQIDDPAIAKEFGDQVRRSLPYSQASSTRADVSLPQFLWDDWMEPDEQNEYKYMLDMDGNGWSGRFHRFVASLRPFLQSRTDSTSSCSLMSTNSLVLKSTIFPEWYTDMIEPWVQ